MHGSSARWIAGLRRSNYWSTVMALTRTCDQRLLPGSCSPDPAGGSVTQARLGDLVVLGAADGAASGPTGRRRALCTLRNEASFKRTKRSGTISFTFN